MEHLSHIVSNQVEEFISIQKVNIFEISSTFSCKPVLRKTNKTDAK